MSSARVSRSIPLPSPLKREKDAAKMIEKQGIVSILGSDFEVNKVAPSLRRTISADMSSKKWLSQNGFSSMKRIASSGELAAASASLPEGDEDDELNIPGQDDVWRSIQLQKEKNEHKKTVQLGVWSSILTEKTNESNNVELSLPYIHPLLKRSASILSEKSLEICTESLGSETGSEGFSNHAPSETGDMEDNKEDAQQLQQEKSQFLDEFEVAKYNYMPGKKIVSRSFPPPLPSLAKANGSSLHMQTHRENGRLLLQAVSVPQRNYFQIERQQGRLLFTLADCPTSLEPSQEETGDNMFGQLFDNCQEVEKHEAIVDKEYGYEDKKGENDKEEEENEQSSRLPNNGVINIQRSTLMMKSFMGLHNKDPTWSSKLNKAVNLMEVEVFQQAAKAPRLIPSPPATTKAASTFNTYEYIWRNKPTMASIINPITQQDKPLKDNTVILSKMNSERVNEQHGMILTRGNKADYMVPLLMRGCKENKRSMLFWQPHSCVATS